MKKLIYLVLLITFGAQSQSYTVIHTIGKIYDTSSESYLKKGSKITDQSSLKFETEGARAAALSSDRGRFVIQQGGSSESTSDIAYALSSVISPVRGRLSTRAGAINNKLDFEKYFDKGTIALIGDTYKISVSSNAYPIDDSKFFYAQYLLNGETINKKLDGENGNIIIDVNQFYSVDDNPVDANQVSEIKLYYYDAGKGSSSFISDVDFSRVKKEEIQSLLSEFEDDMEGALDLINSLYGRVSMEELKEIQGN